MAGKKLTAYDCACRERRIFYGWICFHSLCLVLLPVAVFFSVQYMTLPDHVIVLGRDENLYLGTSAPVESEIVIEDIALRATFALLHRRYDYSNDRQLSMLFDKRGYNQAMNHLDSLADIFKDRQIRQELRIDSVEHTPSGDDFIVLVKGLIVKSGHYFGIPYVQDRDFALMMRLVKAQSYYELPFRVGGMQYYEQEASDEI